VKHFFLVVLVISISFLAHAQTSPKPLFMKAKYDGKLSSTVLSALKDAARASQEYQLVAKYGDRTGRTPMISLS
jgi:hypothetical protein